MVSITPRVYFSIMKFFAAYCQAVGTRLIFFSPGSWSNGGLSKASMNLWVQYCCNVRKVLRGSQLMTYPWRWEAVACLAVICLIAVQVSSMTTKKLVKNKKNRCAISKKCRHSVWAYSCIFLFVWLYHEFFLAKFV